jgi:hypothetical protein
VTIAGVDPTFSVQVISGGTIGSVEIDSVSGVLTLSPSNDGTIVFVITAANASGCVIGQQEVTAVITNCA